MRLRLGVVLVGVLSACPSPPAPTFTVGGEVRGFEARRGGLSLRLGDEVLAIEGDGAFTFSTRLPSGAAYEVTIDAAPSVQRCTVSDGQGTIAGANVDAVRVSCVTVAFSIGGRVEGYEPSLGALSLQLDPGGELAITSPGPFEFPVALASGTAWRVSIGDEPPEQRCQVDGGAGTVTAAVSSVQVACATRTYPLGGTARGVDRPGLTLREATSQQTVAITPDAGTFEFPAPLPFGASYAVTIDSQPTGRDCLLARASGTVPSGGARDLTVTCAPQVFPLEVELTGVDAPGLVLREAATAQTVMPAAGATTAAFPTPLPWETSWQLSVTPPMGRTCGIDGGSGQVLGPIPRPTVACQKQRFPVGGTVRGLDAGTVILRESATSQTLSIPANAPTFVFPTTVEWDTAIAVSIDSQPATRFCTLDGGARVVRGPITDVALACRGGFPVSGQVVNLRGAGLSLTERGTSQLVAIAPDAGGFALPAVVPEGDPLQLEVTSQPANQSCRVETPSPIVSGPVTDVRVVCGPSTSELIVAEVGAVAGPQMPLWVELYNGTSRPIALAGYHLRSASLILADGGAGPLTDFQLPDASLPPATSLLVSGKPFVDLWDTPTQQRFLVQGGLTPVPGPFLELRRGDAGVDVVAFRDAGVVPGWNGAGLTLPSGSTDFGRSLARAQYADTNGPADFETCDWPTPAGLNDVCTSPDADNDGLPDVAEGPDSTWNELPLYAWGARTGQRDVFVEVDWLNPSGRTGALDPGILPRREALERIEQVFRGRNLFVHFDTGGLFHPAPGRSPADFDLGGGNQVPWACTVTLSNVAGATSLYRLKAEHSDVRRRLAFHYALFANALGDVTCANSGNGVSGNAELSGNDLAVALGATGLTLGNQSGINRTINWQSATLMHELGHNLGLRHGGDEDVNWKPNYLSIMNYHYQYDGLPVVGMSEGDRYFFDYASFGVCSGAPGFTNVNTLQRNRNGTPATWGLDYSNGTSITLNEAMLNESAGMGRPGSGPVDWNWNGTIDPMPVSANVNGLAVFPFQCPRTNTGSDLLRDFNDWNALVLPFGRTPRGSATGAPLPPPLLRRPGLTWDAMGDHQPVAEEQPQGLRRAAGEPP